MGYEGMGEKQAGHFGYEVPEKYVLSEMDE